MRSCHRGCTRDCDRRLRRSPCTASVQAGVPRHRRLTARSRARGARGGRGRRPTAPPRVARERAVDRLAGDEPQLRVRARPALDEGLARRSAGFSASATRPSAPSSGNQARPPRARTSSYSKPYSRSHHAPNVIGSPAVGADRRVGPARRHHDDLARPRLDREAPAGVVGRALLHVDDRPAGPDLVELRRRPPAVRGDLVHVALAADGLVAEAARRVGHDAEQQVPPQELRPVLLAADVHRRSRTRGRARRRRGRAGSSGSRRATAARARGRRPRARTRSPSARAAPARRGRGRTPLTAASSRTP